MGAKYLKAIRLKDSLDNLDEYLVNIPVVKYLIEGHSLEFDKPVTFFIGENGSGKSTLLEAIAVSYGFNAEGGSRNFNFSTRKTQSNMEEHLILSRFLQPQDGYFLRAESFYNLATNIDDLEVGSSYGEESLHAQSHGESFLALVQHRFRGKGLYLLDEPEAALSPMRLLTLMVEIDQLVADDSQFIIATHSPILMAYPNARIYELIDSGIKPVKYRDTEHYQLTKCFLENPERMLRVLFSNED
jgi:predicted ATPase